MLRGDWLEGEGEYIWSGGRGTDGAPYQVNNAAAEKYLEEDQAFLVIPKSTASDMSLETFCEIFPANTRKDIYNFDEKEIFEAMKKAGAI